MSGEKVITKLYKANINVFNKEKEIFVLSTSSNFSLVGIKLFNDCKIILEKNKDRVKIIENDNSH
ncbi:hypothetical protein J4221_01130 [Candidatus Pacearchaeota archaeon]|nr:hypothetical protein [Candidatus Pacearchaeota archaeon]